jgi:hypothetical protein
VAPPLELVPPLAALPPLELVAPLAALPPLEFEPPALTFPPDANDPPAPLLPPPPELAVPPLALLPPDDAAPPALAPPAFGVPTAPSVPGLESEDEHPASQKNTTTPEANCRRIAPPVTRPGRCRSNIFAAEICTREASNL